MPPSNYPTTPDGRYFVVRGRLWRRSNPSLPEGVRERLVRELMRARAALRRAQNAGDVLGRAAARVRIENTKVALGERGPVWWDDGAPDYNRRLAVNTPYRVWFESLDG